MIALSGYVVEAHYPDQVTTNDGWLLLVNDRMEYCRGYYAARRELSPRPAMRLRRVADGKVMEESAADLDPRIGMVAGWPTGAQQLAAARRVLVKIRRHRNYVTQREEDRARAAVAAIDAEAIGDDAEADED